MTEEVTQEIVINSDQYNAIMQALTELNDNLADIITSLHYITYIALLFVVIWVFGKILYHMFVEPVCDD